MHLKHAKELKAIREQMGFTVREMADELVLHPATYQGYETGRRKCPAYVVYIARESLKKDREFFKRYRPGGEFDRIIAAQYPCGIASEL